MNTETTNMAFKTRLRPNKSQRNFLNNCLRASRLTFNYALAKTNEVQKARHDYYKSLVDKATSSGASIEDARKSANKAMKSAEIPKLPSATSLRKTFNATKLDDYPPSDYPWLHAATARAREDGFIRLGESTARYFKIMTGKLPRPQTNSKPRKDGMPDFWPRFKSRYRYPQSVTLAYKGEWRIEGKRIKLPRIGWIRMSDTPDLEIVKGGKVTISFDGTNYAVALSLEVPSDQLAQRYGNPQHDLIAVHRGVKHILVDSAGAKFGRISDLDALHAKIANLQRKLARQTHGGKNYAKTAAKIRKLYRRIDNIKHNAMHHASKSAIQKGERIALEDWSITTMIERPQPVQREDGTFEPTTSIARRRNRQLHRAAMGEVGRQITYKAGWANRELIVTERGLPTSTQCSACGELNTVPLSVVTWQCHNCESVHDREQNALQNILNAVQ